MAPKENQTLSGAEEFVSVAMDLAEPLRLDQEKLVRDQLNPFLGAAIDSLHIDQDRISVCYDPTTLSKDTLSKIISEAGGKIKETQTERSPYFS